MTGWRQAVFVRQRRVDVIQRALSKILDEESWSPATPRRLYVGSADASSRGWTMIVPALANFFLDRGGTQALRLCRLACELRCPIYEIDVRAAASTTLLEVDALGRMRISGSPSLLFAGLAGLGGLTGGDAELIGLEVASKEVSSKEVSSQIVGFGLLPIPDDIRHRIASLDGAPPMALADYLGAVAGFPAWTRHGDDAIAAGELVYEPPRIVDRTNRSPTHGPTHGRTNGHLHGPTHVAPNGPASAPAAAELRAQPPETGGAIARTTPRVVPPAHDRRGRRPRSAARPRR
jgi:hypothetical protein